MPTKSQKRARRRQAVDRSERVGPTPETAAKLIPDPFNVLVERGLLDTAQRDAGLEIRAIWYAITGGLLPKAGERSSHRSGEGMSEELASTHALVYVPWCAKWGRAVADVIDLVVDAIAPDSPAHVALALADYARRRRERPPIKQAA